MSELKVLIEKLSKSSPEAVHTYESAKNKIFKYLYIKTKVEEDFISTLEEKKEQKSIIFLCGSSGDGKSAIIANNREKFNEYYNIHIDATHSFRPNQSAIEALDDVFHEFKNNTKSLIVGINMGILLNYARNGSTSHDDIKQIIHKYEKNQVNSDNIIFINFENYPKFEMENESITSTFINKLLQNITKKSKTNPFYLSYLTDLNKNIFNTEHKNFVLLSNNDIQKSIIGLLVTVHLKYDQFLTARSLLDFIYTILNGTNLLIDELFENETNMILSNIKKEDPLLVRSKNLDTFILERSSNKLDEELEEFIKEFNTNFYKPVFTNEKRDFHTLVRLFFLVKDNLTFSYHKKFFDDFIDTTTYDFVKLIISSQNYSNDTKKTINKFYYLIRKSIFSYANKKNPKLTNDGLFHFETINNYDICTYLEIDPNLKEIQKYINTSINSFKCFLKVNDKTLSPFEININMYKLLTSINNGYRPNKHDRNTIIVFEELIELISNEIKDSKKLVFIKDNKKTVLKNNDDEIEVIDNVY